MKTWTRTLIASAALTAFVATPAFANHPSYKDAPLTFPVTIPAMKGGFQFNVTGIYAQPNIAPFSKSITSSDTTSITDAPDVINSKTYYMDMDYKWAFSIGGGYIIDNTGNDIQIKWEHLDNTTSDSNNFVGNEANNVLSSNFVTATFTLQEGDTASLQSKIKVVADSVTLDVGQYVNFGSRLSTRWSIGARYAKLQGYNDYTITGTQDGNGDADQGPFDYTSAVEDKFTGLGPQVGVSANYMVWNGIGVVAASSGFLLPGRMHTSVSATQISLNMGDVQRTNYEFPQEYNVVLPGFDAKLGLNYTANWPSNKLDYLNLELGYTTTHYSNGLDVTIFGSAIEHSDFSYGGPYVSMNLRFS